MASNTIIFSIIFQLLLSIRPSHGSDNVTRFSKNHLKSFGYLLRDYKSTDDDTHDTDTFMMKRRPPCNAPHRPSTDDARNVTPNYSFCPGNPTWPKSMRRLKYTFLNAPPIPFNNASAAISRAFSTWSAVSVFTFIEMPGFSKPAHIRIGFFRGIHGDGYPFDGPGGQYAHSFPPPEGFLHFDADENWGTVQGARILDLESVAVHEIGHILGLGHSDRPSAVMYGRFGYGLIRRHLDQDDIAGIRALYPE